MSELLREVLALVPIADASPGVAMVYRQRYGTLRELAVPLLTQSERSRLPAQARTSNIRATTMADIVVLTKDLLALLSHSPQ